MNKLKKNMINYNHKLDNHQGAKITYKIKIQIYKPLLVNYKSNTLC